MRKIFIDQEKEAKSITLNRTEKKIVRKLLLIRLEQDREWFRGDTKLSKEIFYLGNLLQRKEPLPSMNIENLTSKEFAFLLEKGYRKKEIFAACKVHPHSKKAKLFLGETY